jgi:hypothetical protein
VNYFTPRSTVIGTLQKSHRTRLPPIPSEKSCATANEHYRFGGNDYCPAEHLVVGRKSPVLRGLGQCWEYVQSSNSHPSNSPILLRIFNYNRRFAKHCFSNSRPGQGRLAACAQSEHKGQERVRNDARTGRKVLADMATIGTGNGQGKTRLLTRESLDGRTKAPTTRPTRRPVIRRIATKTGIFHASLSFCANRRAVMSVASRRAPPDECRCARRSAPWSRSPRRARVCRPLRRAADAR